ncbi:helix-turn-helix domain-containing protein [Sporomusa malonica]|uniref:Helix-turn-helix domain-containing protein n=1 Tax=Sporomusa malonica TaxID=112901 RepID=A0A1W2AUW0_9FIRM|nr:helix-turn-helix transcriptional regulator [Sporomusa malonica]SMC64292.1 Helix-turn-helix domain-containing protein [Sporomusa malonica]
MNLKNIREAKNLSQYRLAKISGVSQGLLSSYELKKKKPGLDNLIKLATALDVTIAELIDGSDQQAATLPKTG